MAASSKRLPKTNSLELFHQAVLLSPYQLPLECANQIGKLHLRVCAGTSAKAIVGMPLLSVIGFGIIVDTTVVGTAREVTRRRGHCCPGRTWLKEDWL